ncbi:MAG: hypothetical protein JWO31_2699, partial [Phycisphaerales bacterium]|nr:hypothetical protein [Phycisphaerales bacterium]
GPVLRRTGREFHRDRSEVEHARAW